MTEKLLELKDISKNFSLSGKKHHAALSHVNLSVYKGETLGVLGESGCGKSTLARIIMGVYPPSQGQVLYQGQPLKLRNQKARRAFAEHAQMIFQDPFMALDPHMNVKSIISENLEIHGKLDKKGREDRVYQLLEMVGLSREHAARYPHEFSGGQRQRIGIARALAILPDFIICDEPLSALDNTIQSHIMNLLMRLKEEFSFTCLFITHDLNVARCISDRIAVMYAGKVVEIGKAEEVCERPLHPYTRMLLHSALSYEPGEKRLEEDVKGEVWDVSAKGCPFGNRCMEATAECLEHVPQLEEYGEGHMAACGRVGTKL